MRTAIALTILLAPLSGGGCQHHPLILYDTEQGMQWYWPHFLASKPTILAFWSTEEIECLRAIDGLNTLDMHAATVQLISIATGPDRGVIDTWIQGRRGTPVNFTVLVDQEERLANKLKVSHYPTYIYFDVEGMEIDRSEHIGNIRKWFYVSWLKKAGGSY